MKLQTYTGELIPVVGKLTVRARKAEQPIAEGVPCSLFVVDGHGPCLLGRDLMEALGIVINQVRVESTIGSLPFLAGGDKPEGLRSLLEEHKEFYGRKFPAHQSQETD